MNTSYYIVAVDENGDVLAIEASIVAREGLAITVASNPESAVAFENQGDDADSKGESARDALAAIMPEADDYGVCSECGREMPGDPENDVCATCSETTV